MLHLNDKRHYMDPLENKSKQIRVIDQIFKGNEQCKKQSVKMVDKSVK
jgi:hypothetical protein